MPKKPKFEEDCKIPFMLDWRVMYGKAKSCGLKVKYRDFTLPLSYVPVPASVRFCHTSFVRYFKTEEGQDVIKMELFKKGYTDV
jgi:hypothetical protein